MIGRVRQTGQLLDGFLEVALLPALGDAGVAAVVGDDDGAVLGGVGVGQRVAGRGRGWRWRGILRCGFGRRRSRRRCDILQQQVECI